MAKAKEIPGLDCAMNSTEGLDLILRSRLEEMTSFRDAALDWSDIEGVHDMRVASRRLRSALKDFAPYLRRRKLKQAKEDFRQVARLLGAVRDQDVALSALEKLAAEAPAGVSAGIDQFAGRRQHKQKQARAQLEDALTVDSLQKLRMEFHSALEESSKALRTSADDDDRESLDEATLQQVAHEIINERLRDLHELSTSLYRPFESDSLHEMRIAAKRLRYAIELFTPCLGGDELKHFCKEISKMQDSLGELHDCDEWIAEIGVALAKTPEDKLDEESSIGKHQEDGPSGDETVPESGMADDYAAMLWLLDHFVKERTEHFRAALERWRDWQATSFEAQLLAAMHNHSQTAESSAPTPAEAAAVSGIVSHEN